MTGRRAAIKAASLTLTACLAVSGCGDDGEPEEAADIETLRFGSTDLTGLEELQREFGPFRDAFAELSGYEIEFFAVSDRTAAAAALQADQVDILLTGPAEYVVMSARADAEPIAGISRPDYRSCLYTHVDTGITELADLEGKRVGMLDVGSTSGHLGPSQILADAGINPLEDVEVLNLGDTVHEALVRGDVDAVGHNCEVYEELMQSEDNPDDYPLLMEGPTLPPDVFVHREGLPQEVVDRVEQTITTHFPKLLAAMQEGLEATGDRSGRLKTAELVLVEDSDYDVVRSMYENVGVDDFSEFIGD